MKKQFWWYIISGLILNPIIGYSQNYDTTSIRKDTLNIRINLKQKEKTNKEVEIIQIKEMKDTIKNKNSQSPPIEKDTIIKKKEIIQSITPPVSHIKFKGIEITGTITNFVKQMEKKGFELSPDKEFLYGTLGDYKIACKVKTIQNSQDIYFIASYFPTVNEWKVAKNMYEELKLQLKKKYGKPTISIEKFIYPYNEGDGYEYKAIKNNAVDFDSFWELNNGTIELFIAEGLPIRYLNPNKYDGFCIILVYTDKFGESIIYKTKNESYANDL